MEIDVQKEWRELVETYSQMADEELQSLAAEGNELTDVAKQALQSQLKARGLKVELVDAAPVCETFDRDGPRGDVDPSELELIDIAHASRAEDARAIKTALDKGGVPSFIGPNNIDNVDDYHGSFEDGIPIRVLASDQQRAARALAQFFPATPEEGPTEGDGYRARCPKCHSDEIVFLELDRSAAPTTGEPKFHWHCDACGNDWEDDGVEEN